MKKLFISLMTAGVLSTSAVAAPETYMIDSTHTNVIASWNHFGFSNPTAASNGAKGTIVYDKDAPEKSKVDVSVKIDTINSFVDKLTDEFMDKAWFDESDYPEATFVSKKVVAEGDDTFKVTGDLTIKGVTKTVTMDATLNGIGTHPMNKKQAIGFDATTTIMRSDFGLDKYVPNVSDEVTLRITTEAHAK